MKVLLIVANFPPEIGSASHLFFDLAKNLSKKSHNVTVLTTFPRKDYLPTKGSKRRGIWSIENCEGFTINRIISFIPQINNIFSRGLEHILLPISFLLGGILIRKHDVILIYSPPLPIGVSGYLLKKIKGSSLIINIQDLYPKSVIDMGIMRSSALVRIFEIIERFVYRKSDLITVHSESNAKYVVKRALPTNSRVVVIPNWVNIAEFEISDEKYNSIRKGLGIKNSDFLVSYAGLMSTSQDLELIIKAAKQLKEIKDIRFLLVGEGVEKPKLERLAEEYKLDNIIFLPLIPKKEYVKVLKASDVCLVTLQKFVKTPVVPSKLIAIMASKRAVIMAAPLKGDAPKIIKTSKCGLIVPPSDADSLNSAIRTFFEDRKLLENCGNSGKSYAKERFSSEVCIRKYDLLIRMLTRSTRTKVF